MTFLLFWKINVRAPRVLLGNIRTGKEKNWLTTLQKEKINLSFARKPLKQKNERKERTNTFGSIVVRQRGSCFF